MGQSASTKERTPPAAAREDCLVRLALGILLFPLIFVWFTLRRGHTTISRVLAFSWLITAFFLTIALQVIDLSSMTNEIRSDPVNTASPEAGDLGSTSPSVTNSGSQPDVTTTDTSAPSTEQPVPTTGQFTDKVMIGIGKFAEIYRKKGMIGAEHYSRACSRAALQSNDILDLDFCVAFDMSAILADHEMVQSGMPRHEYFASRAKEIDGEYGRFAQAAPARTSLIWNEVRQRLPAIISR